MQKRSLVEKVPAHLACAVITFAFVALGSGACDRTADAGHADAKAPSSAHVDAGPERTAEPSKAPLPQAAPASNAKATPAKAAAEPAPAAPGPVNEAAAAKPTRAHRYVIAALGDSITDKRSHGGGFLDYVAARCPESVIDNYGKGGDMVNQMRRRFERDLLPVAKQRGYTHLIVFGGVNDLYSDLTAGRTNELIESDLSAIYAQAKQSGMAVVAITVAPWGGFSRYFNAPRGESTRLLNGWMTGQVETKAVDRVVDAYALLSCGDPELLCPEYSPPFKDGLHPGTKGHEVLGKALFDAAFADCR